MNIKSKLIVKPFSKENLNDVFELDKDISNNFKSINQLLEYVNDGKYINVIGIVDSVVVGYIISLIVLDEVHIHTVYVSKNFRRKRIATKLIQTILDKSKILRKKKLCLEVSCCNINAIGLYEKIGFTKVGNRKEYYKEGIDAILMDLNF